MVGFRNRFIRNTSFAVRLFPTKLLTKLSNQNFILPFYHAVSDSEMPHIRHLYPVKGIKAFESDLDDLLKHFKPIDYLEFRTLKAKGEEPAKPSFLLSFDDGLSEFHNVIAPILLRKGIPAICFLNSAFIDNKDLFFRYKASLLIHQCAKYPELYKKLFSKFGKEYEEPHDLLNINYKNKTILDEMAGHIGFSFDEFLKRDKPYLDSEQIHTLINKGFHFGAHSIDHPNYQFIDESEQLRQTVESVENICNRFKLKYKAFSFPFTDHNVSLSFFKQLKEVGIVENTFGCAGQKRDDIDNNFQRIPFELNKLTGKQILKSELLYAIVKETLGKNRITRT